MNQMTEDKSPYKQYVIISESSFNRLSYLKSQLFNINIGNIAILLTVVFLISSLNQKLNDIESSNTIAQNNINQMGIIQSQFAALSTSSQIALQSAFQQSQTQYSLINQLLANINTFNLSQINTVINNLVLLNETSNNKIIEINQQYPILSGLVTNYISLLMANFSYVNTSLFNVIDNNNVAQRQIIDNLNHSVTFRNSSGLILETSQMTLWFASLYGSSPLYNYGGTETFLNLGIQYNDTTMKTINSGSGQTSIQSSSFGFVIEKNALMLLSITVSSTSTTTSSMRLTLWENGMSSQTIVTFSGLSYPVSDFYTFQFLATPGFWQISAFSTPGNSVFTISTQISGFSFN
jgi:hypothetical protein